MRWVKSKARELSMDFQEKARRGIRLSGTLVVFTALVSVTAIHFQFPVVLPLGLLGFVSTSASHLVAVWIVDKGGPRPACPTCMIPLNVHKHKCGVCRKTFSV